MASARRLYRLGLALEGLGAAALMLAGWVSLGAVSLSPAPVEALIAACARFASPELSAGALIAFSLMAPGIAALVLGSRPLLCQLRAQHRFAARLELSRRVDVDGSEVLVLQGPRPRAFCAGYLRPRIYVSSGALALLSDAELGAVVAHERHHRMRRDPLRLLVLRTLSESLFFLPVLRRLADRYGALAEMAADEAAARERGRRPRSPAARDRAQQPEPAGGPRAPAALGGDQGGDRCEMVRIARVA